MPSATAPITVSPLRTAYYPGRFDPVHNGHLALALQVVKQGLASEVVFIPEHDTADKTSSPVTPVTDRLEMLKAATQPFPFFRVALPYPNPAKPVFWDLVQPNLKTGTTVKILKKSTSVQNWIERNKDWLFNPSNKTKDIFELLIGINSSDSKGVPIRPVLKEHNLHTVFIKQPFHTISSTHIRETIRQGCYNLLQCLPTKVLEYIRAAGLYKPPANEIVDTPAA